MKKIVNNIEVDSKVDYYAILGVKKEDTCKDILTKGYSVLSCIANNDNGLSLSAREKYNASKVIMNAINVLSDKKAKKAYDDMISSNINDIDEEEIRRILKEIQKEHKRVCEEVKEEEINDEYIDEENDEYIDEKDVEDKNDEYIDEEINRDIMNDQDLQDILDEEQNDDVVDAQYEEADDRIKVDNVEEADHALVKKAKKSFSLKSLVQAAGIIILTGAIGLAAYSITKTQNNLKELKKTIEADNLNTDNYVEAPVAPVQEPTEVQTVAPAQTTDVTASTAETEKAIEVTPDVNSETVIQNTTDKVYSVVSSSTNSTVKDMFDRDTVESLVRYTRDNSVLSGENAYELFKVLYMDKIDISMFFENLDSYEYMNKLYSSTSKIDEKNNSYDDEYAAFLAIGDAVDKMDANNYAEVWAVSVSSDYSTYYASMNIARGGAKENGQEGQEYIDEKNKVHANIKEECSAIYNKVRTDDQNSLLMKARMNALNNENVRSLN